MRGLAPQTAATQVRRGNTPPAHHASDVMVFTEVLRRQWRAIAACTIAVFVTVVAATLLMKPVYEPQARLEVDPPGNEEFTLDLPHIATNETEYLQTQVQNLQSDELAVEVIRKLHLATDPASKPGASGDDSTAPDMSSLTPSEDAALRDFKRRLKVQNNPGSRVVSVSVEAHNRFKAAKITNTLASLYVQRSTEARDEAIQQSVAWLSDQLEHMRKRMEDSNQELANFESANGIADVGDGRSTYGDLLTDLDKQRSQTAAERIRLQALLGKQAEKNADSLPQVEQSKLIQDVTEKQADVLGQLAQAKAIYGPNHPNVKRLQDQANALQAQLSQEKSGILAEVQREYAAAQAQERLMNGEVKDTTKRLSVMAKYEALKRDATANASLYNTLYSKIKDAEISAASKSSNIRIVDAARVLDRPTRPERGLNAGLGLAGGLLLGIMVAFLREGLENRVRTSGDIQDWGTRLPVSILPMIAANGGGANVGANRWLRMINGPKPISGYEALLISRPRSPEAEAVRGLRASLMFSREGSSPPQALLIASSLPGEGKTTVAMNLAVAFSQEGPTCVMDCDLRGGTMSRIFQLGSKQGLSDALNAKCDLDETVYDTNVLDLAVIPSGLSRENGHSLISPRAMREVLQVLRRRFTYIVIDSPPLLPCVDGRLVSRVVDGVVFVGRSRVTSREAMARSLELLAEVKSAPILEVVLNAAEEDCADYQYYHYAY